MTQIAIVGAGIAGMAAARCLGMAGFECTIFEKSRGLGGRMANRRVQHLQFDHGAQFFSARGPRFRELVAEWQKDKLADYWFDGAFVGTPGMTAPARSMAAPHTIVPGTRVVSLALGIQGWTLETETGAVETPNNGLFAAVILAVPAPQAIPLAATAHLAFPELETVRYAPCWALMLAYDDAIHGVDDRITLEHGPIRWIARDNSKPGRSSKITTFVVHASPEWSRRHLELSAEDAALELTENFRSITGISAHPTYVTAHRWRFALVEETAGAAYLWNGDAKLGACGDWALGPRVECAFDSGEALANAIIQALVPAFRSS